MDFDYVVVPALIVLIGGLIGWVSIRRVLSLQGKSYPTWRKVAERIALSLVVLITLTVTGSSGFNAIELYYFRHPPPGEMYMVDGHKMRIDCTGNGSPVIFLEAGAGNDGLTWGKIQPMLAKTTRVCSYDRAGMGWSDSLPPPRDADHIAIELHRLLAVAKVDGPIVLMGHSRGGLFIRDYVTRYPAEVAGLVFLDSSTPLQNRNPAFEAHDAEPRGVRFDELLNRVLLVSGAARLFGACSGDIPGFDAHSARVFAEDRCHESFGGIALEDASFDLSGEETVHSGPYGALPILILSHDTATEAADGAPADLLKAFGEMQENLKMLSTRSRRIIAKDSGHYIQLDRPELIEREVPLFVEQIRGTAPQPTDYGSTSEQ
jgi:pimeloyl-ACP methyl ester carboxylesterase